MGHPGLELGNSGRNTLLCSVRSDHYRIKEAGPLVGKSLHMHMWLRPRPVLRRAPSRHKAVGSLVLSDAGISAIFRGQGRPVWLGMSLCWCRGFCCSVLC